MADMSNEQAARVLTKEADGWGDERVSFGTYITALRMGAAALREIDAITNKTPQKGKPGRYDRQGCPQCSWIDPKLAKRPYCAWCGRWIKDGVQEAPDEP